MSPASEPSGHRHPHRAYCAVTDVKSYQTNLGLGMSWHGSTTMGELKANLCKGFSVDVSYVFGVYCVLCILVLVSSNLPAVCDKSNNTQY